MSEPSNHLTPVQIERLLAELGQQSGSLTPDDMQRLEELVQRVGGIEAAQELFEALEDLEADGGTLEDLNADLLDDLDEDDDLEQVAA
jgi:hypothetical protein